MDDFNSETDSDYTSYWRDWVSAFNLLPISVVRIFVKNEAAMTAVGLLDILVPPPSRTIIRQKLPARTWTETLLRIVSTDRQPLLGNVLPGKHSPSNITPMRMKTARGIFAVLK